MSITTTPYGFNPALTAGLVLWLDASDATTITQSSGSISQWIDKSTSALTATAVNNPILVANVQNGFPGISLDGSTQYFNLGNNLNMGTNQLYIFIVSKFNSTADGAIIGKSLYGGATGRYSLLRIGGILNPLVQGSGGVNNTGVNSDTSTSTRLLNMVWDRSNINLYQNGSSVFSLSFSDTSNLTTGNSLLIGAYQNSSGGTPPQAGLYMNGYIHEILMYMTPTGSPLGNIARQQIESYLAQKWGLTLSAGHPGLTSTVYRSTYLKNSAVKRNIATMTPFFTAFSPRQIGGLALWLDSTDSSTISFSSGSNISQWRDKSGSSNHFSLITGTTTTVIDNRKTVVYFPSGAVMGSANQITFTTSSAFYIVSKLTSLSTSMLVGFTNIANGGGSAGDFSIRFSSSVLYGTSAQGGNGQDFANGAYYVNGTLNPSFGSDVYLNVYSIIGTVASTVGGTSFVTLSSSFISRFFIGYIAEFLYFPAGLTSTQRQQIESYLAQKWGLTSSLAAGHLHLTQPAGAPGLVKKINRFNLIAILLSSGFMSTVFNLASYSLANIANAVSAASNSVVYIYSVSIPSGAKGKNGILVIFFNLYSLTAFSAGQYFDYGIYIDGTSQLLGDATGTIRYSQTASGTFAMSSAGISLGTNGLGNGFPLIVPVTFSAEASVIQIGLKNSLSALSIVSSTGLGYLTNVLTSSGTSNTANFIPQNTFTTVGASTYTVPTNTSAGVPVGVFIYCWGSGGCAAGGIYAGGSGGFVSGFYQCSPGTALYVVVGAIGTTSPTSGGGGTANQGNASSLQAGGFSGVFINGAATQANCICLGGGGGGAQNSANGGGGGGGYPDGGNGNGGTGGSQSVQGSPFSSAGGNGAPAGGALIGASTYSVGAGGGGYWGGGCGNSGGGGGGSSFIDRLTSGATYANGGTVLGSSTPSANVPGGSGNSFYQSGKGVGNGVQQTTGTGLVVIVPAVGTNSCQIGVSAKLYSG